MAFMHLAVSCIPLQAAHTSAFLGQKYLFGYGGTLLFFQPSIFQFSAQWLFCAEDMLAAVAHATDTCIGIAAERLETIKMAGLPVELFTTDMSSTRIRWAVSHSRLAITTESVSHSMFTQTLASRCHCQPLGLLGAINVYCKYIRTDNQPR